MAVLRATRLWWDWIAAGLQTLPAEDIPDRRIDPRATTGKPVYTVPAGHKAILRSATAVLSGGFIPGEIAVWGICWENAPDGRYWLHWESFDVYLSGDQSVQLFTRQWEGMLVLNPGDTLGVYGASFAYTMNVSGSGMQLPIGTAL